jgi:hypothetical protein
VYLVIQARRIGQDRTGKGQGDEGEGVREVETDKGLK